MSHPTTDLEKGAGVPTWSPPSYEQHVNDNMRQFQIVALSPNKQHNFDHISEPTKQRRCQLTRRQWAWIAVVLCFLVGSLSGLAIWGVLAKEMEGNEVNENGTASVAAAQSPRAEVTEVVTLMPEVVTVFITPTPKSESTTVVKSTVTPEVVTVTANATSSTFSASTTLATSTFQANSTSTTTTSSLSSSSTSTSSSTTSSSPSTTSPSSTTLLPSTVTQPAETSTITQPPETNTVTARIETQTPATTLTGWMGFCGVLGQAC